MHAMRQRTTVQSLEMAKFFSCEEGFEEHVLPHVSALFLKKTLTITNNGGFAARASAGFIAK